VGVHPEFMRPVYVIKTVVDKDTISEVGNATNRIHGPLKERRIWFCLILLVRQDNAMVEQPNHFSETFLHILEV
jgi:hypothetical protein